MDKTRSGWNVSAQIAKMGLIYTDEMIGDFQLEDGNCFQIKNEGEEPIELTVQLAGMNDEETVTTNFDPGWNPEIVRRVVGILGSENYNLKWGY